MERRAYQRGITAEEWEARRAEGKKSLNAGLSDSEVIFILNDELSVAAATLTKVAKFREYDRAQERKARNCAAALLKHLESQTD